jgi:hypothetical protein
MSTVTNARIQFSTASVNEWEKVNPKLREGEPVIAKKSSGKYILKVGAIGGSTYKDSVLAWDEENAEALTSTATAAASTASASASAAKTSEANAKTSETNAATSASTASSKASEAATSASTASSKASAAATSASTASSKATAAASSATAAANSASAASTSETNAKASEKNASTSATSASSSADAAKTSETNAKASEQAASSSESNAATYAANAKTSETNAASSASTASSKASAAATSASSASTYATNASTSADIASDYMNDAKTYASNASTSADKAESYMNQAFDHENRASSFADSAYTAQYNAATSATKAASSATAAAESATKAATFDPNTYMPKTEIESTYLSKADLTPQKLWDVVHSLGENYVPTDTTNAGWNNLGLAISSYDTAGKIANQPSTSGQLINIPKSMTGSEAMQMWLNHADGAIYTRRGDGTDAVNDQTFKKLAFEDNAGVVAGDVSNVNAWWVKLGGTVPLIIQGGYTSSCQKTITLPVQMPNALMVAVGCSTWNFDEGICTNTYENTSFFIHYRYSESGAHWLAIGF